MTPDLQPRITKPRRLLLRWFRFSVRSALAFMTLFGCLLGWIGIERSKSNSERQVVKRLQNESLTCQPTFIGLFDLPELYDQKETQSWWRNLAREILGVRVYGIDISGSQEVDLSLLAGLQNLQQLKVSNGTRITDLTPLAEHKSLQQLTLSSMDDLDLTPLTELKYLQQLTLNIYHLTDLTPIAELKGLKQLTLSTGLRDPDLSPFGELKKLERLTLYNNMRVTDLSPLSGLKKLQRLHFSVRHYTDFTLNEQINTESRWWDGRKRLTDLTPLAELGNMTELSLLNTPASIESIYILQQSLPNCKIVPSS